MPPKLQNASRSDDGAPRKIINFRTDIFQLGYILWLLAEHKSNVSGCLCAKSACTKLPRYPNNRSCSRPQNCCNFRRMSCATSDHDQQAIRGTVSGSRPEARHRQRRSGSYVTTLQRSSWTGHWTAATASASLVRGNAGLSTAHGQNDHAASQPCAPIPERTAISAMDLVENESSP
jgi:hypothetical protein